MPDHGAESYASALCCSCSWKLSGADEADTPPVVRRDVDTIAAAGHTHAETFGHVVSLIISTHRRIDCTAVGARS